MMDKVSWNDLDTRTYWDDVKNDAQADELAGAFSDDVDYDLLYAEDEDYPRDDDDGTDY